MNKKGFTLIELLTVIVIIGILIGIALPNILRAKIESNHAFTKSTLNTVSKALEIYYNMNAKYPENINDLLIADPPYLNKDYFSDTYRGYNYNVVEMKDNSYIILAIPQSNNTGIKVFGLETGGVLNET